MNERIVQQARDLGFDVERGPGADVVCATVGLQRFVITLPRRPSGTLERFVGVRSTTTGAAMGSDWIDHCAVDGETQDQLIAEREAEAVAFLRRVARGPVDPADIWGTAEG